MATPLPSQIFEQFQGIREYNGVNYGGQISALSCINVELVKTEIGNATGIKTVQGDKIFVTLPEGYKAIKNFSHMQKNVNYMFVYGETETKGTLFKVDVLENIEVIIDDLPISGNCNGISMNYGLNQIFVFSNGKEAYSIDLGSTEPTRKIEATDNKGRPINWLSMTEWNGFLVVASDYGVHASHQNDIYTWADDVNGSEDSWYIDFGKKVTAVIAFSTGLFIFTDKDVSYLSGTPNKETSVLQNVAMNGCFSFESVVAHDTFLFFYDDNQKGVFYIQMTDTGQTRPVGSVTKEIQSFFTTSIDRVKMYSCIYDTYNEIWMLINDKIIIYDYLNQEFIERQMQPINSLCMYRNKVYVCNDLGQIKIEKMQEDFAGVYYPAEYKTTFINMGSNSNLKKQKTPLLLVLNENYTNNFFVEITANYKTKNPKKITLKVGTEGEWAPEEENAEIENKNLWDVAYWCEEGQYRKRVVEISTPQTWYTLGVRFFTTEEEGQGQGFHIVSMELKRLKEKTKTKGR